MDRRRFMKGSTALGIAMSAKAQSPGQSGSKSSARAAQNDFWPGGARFVVSLSLQMEAGAQAERGASGPWGALDTKYPDLPTEKWYEYGFKEGIPRLLDMYDRRKVKVTSHMVGMAVEKHPALAKEIVQRGHEAAAHSHTWNRYTPKRRTKSEPCTKPTFRPSSGPPGRGPSASTRPACGRRRRLSGSCRISDSCITPTI